MSRAEIEPSLTSTITECVVAPVVLIALLALSALGQAASPSQANQNVLQQDVKRLGLPDNDDFADVKRLALNPAAAAQLLISELGVLDHPERTIVGDGSPHQEHILWSILALRYITGGMDFCAPTEWRSGSAYEEGIRSYWLHFYSKSCVTFFADWPSRGRTYTAPLDAQRSIISAWQQWYAKEGKDFNYKPLVNPEAWQWPGGVQKLVRVGNDGKPVTKGK